MPLARSHQAPAVEDRGFSLLRLPYTNFERSEPGAGSWRLVQARGREWVVLPESERRPARPAAARRHRRGDRRHLPAAGRSGRAPATFDLPDPTDLGDYRSGRLLRDAVRLGFRSSAGPFRSFGRIAVEPRPYQLVPLLMALKLDPVRLLIADDVGIGKTIEAGLVARELLDRGEVQRLAVLCPPHLAEQWQAELRDKFHIEAELVLPSTASRLERDIAAGPVALRRLPVRGRLDRLHQVRAGAATSSLRACPELVIVDEAHTCAFMAEDRGRPAPAPRAGQGLAADPDRHLVLVTATPHSGKEERLPLAAGAPATATSPTCPTT